MNLGQIREIINKKAKGRKELPLDEIEVICCNIYARANRGSLVERPLIKKVLALDVKDSIIYPVSYYKNKRTPFGDYIRAGVRGKAKVSVCLTGKNRHWEIRKVKNL